MAKKTDTKKPTEGELAILSVIWDRGPSTVREVFECLAAASTGKEVGYTTVLKLMQIMVDKGLLERDASVRPQVFRPAKPRKQTQKQLLGDLLDKAFGGSPGNLVLQALATKKATPDELRRIREMLDRLDDPASDSSDEGDRS